MRNPLVDPRPGDVIIKTDAWARIKGKPPIVREWTILSVAHGAVRIKSDPPMPAPFAGYFHLSDWPFYMRERAHVKLVSGVAK